MRIITFLWNEETYENNSLLIRIDIRIVIFYSD